MRRKECEMGFSRKRCHENSFEFQRKSTRGKIDFGTMEFFFLLATAIQFPIFVALI